MEEKAKDDKIVEKESWDQKFWDSNPWQDDAHSGPVESHEQVKAFYPNTPSKRQPLKNDTSYVASKDRYTTKTHLDDDKSSSDDSAWRGTVLAPVESQQYGRR